MTEFKYLVEALKDNGTIEETSKILGREFVDREIAFTPYFKTDSVSLQLHGWEIVLLENGKYFINDTSGG